MSVNVPPEYPLVMFCLTLDAGAEVADQHRGILYCSEVRTAYKIDPGVGSVGGCVHRDGAQSDPYAMPSQDLGLEPTMLVDRNLRAMLGCSL
ncbi:hypothetical protein BDV59DRAFT_169063 [Aspergillus ambiguus]|uniref:uncharacterized protein n=1 Tax=Aspergillus ambiguus TaxID=176160 RepID=UPI003CCCC29C